MTDKGTSWEDKCGGSLLWRRCHDSMMDETDCCLNSSCSITRSNGFVSTGNTLGWILGK